eukprot:7267489-Pyramimonas_sp.AAC.4
MGIGWTNWPSDIRANLRPRAPENNMGDISNPGMGAEGAERSGEQGNAGIEARRQSKFKATIRPRGQRVHGPRSRSSRWGPLYHQPQEIQRPLETLRRLRVRGMLKDGQDWSKRSSKKQSRSRRAGLGGDARAVEELWVRPFSRGHLASALPNRISENSRLLLGSRASVFRAQAQRRYGDK